MKNRPNELRRRVAGNMKLARQLSGLTQQQLAERSELHLTSVQKFERLVSAPTVDSIEALAKALKLPAHVLFLERADALVEMRSISP